MTVCDLLGALRDAGITLTVEGSDLQFRAPVGAMTADLRTSLAVQKRELIEALRPPLVERGLIGCPWSNLIVRGPGYPQQLVSARRIPQEAREYHWHGNDWRSIPEHWRILKK